LSFINAGSPIKTLEDDKMKENLLLFRIVQRSHYVSAQCGCSTHWAITDFFICVLCVLRGKTFL